MSYFSLKIKLNDPNSETILDPEFLEKFRNLHLFLQSVRFKFNFNYFVPWSILILKSHIYDNEKENFDYHDEIFSLVFSIRMGDICIFSCPEDNGAQKQIFEEYFNKFKAHPIHPIQFDEVSAKIAYKSSLMNRTPKYFSIFPDNEEGIFEITSLPLQGFLKTSIYDDWDPKNYIKYLNLYWHRWGIEEQEIYKEPDLVYSTLENKDGTMNKLDKYGNPVKN